MKIRRLIDTGEWTTRRYLSLLGTLLIWVIVAIDAWYLWPTQLGGDTSIVVVSGKSMEPTYFGGDLVIARDMDPSIGDVIIYAPEGLGGSQIVHRVIGGNADDGWQMQGDNNSFIDPFAPRGDEVKGVVLVHYSNFGRVTVLLLNPMVWAFVLLAAMVLMLWYTGDDCDDRDDDDEDRDQDEDAGDGDPESEAEEELDLIDRVVEGTEAALARMVASGATAGATVLALLTRRSASPRHAAPVSSHSAPTYLRAAPLGGSAVLAVLLVVGLWVAPASASGLQINTSGGVGSMTYGSCLTGPVDVSAVGSNNKNDYSHVYVEGLTSACVGLPITVGLYKNSGALVASASGTVGAGGYTFTTSGVYKPNQVATAVVTVGGWVKLANWTGVLASFDCVGVDASGAVVDPNCYFTSKSGSGWPSNAPSTGNAYFNGVTNAPYVILTIDLGQIGGFTPSVVNPTGTVSTTFAPGATCASLPVISIMRPVQNYAYSYKEFWGGLDYYTSPAQQTASSICPQ